MANLVASQSLDMRSAFAVLESDAAVELLSTLDLDDPTPHVFLAIGGRGLAMDFQLLSSGDTSFSVALTGAKLHATSSEFSPALWSATNLPFAVNASIADTGSSYVLTITIPDLWQGQLVFDRDLTQLLDYSEGFIGSYTSFIEYILRGADTIAGSTGNDYLLGYGGNDTLNGGLGNDTMVGGQGNDTYVVSAAGDVVMELSGQGTDTVSAGFSYTLGTNVENLALTGASALNGTGNGLGNRITGNAGNNVLNGGAGNDVMVGGAGNDTYVLNVATDVVYEAANAGMDTVQSPATYTLPGNVENLVLTGSYGIHGTGNALNNVITGNSGHNTLNGGAGNDTLAGGAGSDTLNGSDGNDTLAWDAADVSVNGGMGIDTLRVDGAGQTLNLLAVANSKIQHMEVINLTGSGDNRLELNLQDVLDLSVTTNTLRVDGNAGDVVDHNTGWAMGALYTIGANTYRVYNQGLATLLVDTDIAVTT